MSSEDEGEGPLGPEPHGEAVQSLLSKEIKELRGRIVATKKSIAKGDKKAKKAVQEEVGLLEAELEAKQEQLRVLKEPVVVDEKASETAAAEERARIAHEKKERKRLEREAVWEANRQAALAEVANRPDLANIEAAAFSEQLAREGFTVLEVAADGHCLFTAIGCLLVPSKDHWEVRGIAADYLLAHRSDFEAFVEDTGCAHKTADVYAEYCGKIRATGHWGGQIELEALSRAFDCSFTVHQANLPPCDFNPDARKRDRPHLHLSYHRHAFSLGEHYNALVPKDPNA
jgi:OTU domain-containing protein 6